MKTKIGFQNPLSLNAGQKYCRMLQGEHSSKFLTFIKLPLVTKIFVLSIFEWPLKTSFTVILNILNDEMFRKCSSNRLINKRNVCLLISSISSIEVFQEVSFISDEKSHKTTDI